MEKDSTFDFASLGRANSQIGEYLRSLTRANAVSKIESLLRIISLGNEDEAHGGALLLGQIFARICEKMSWAASARSPIDTDDLPILVYLGDEEQDGEAQLSANGNDDSLEFPEEFRLENVEQFEGDIHQMNSLDRSIIDHFEEGIDNDRFYEMIIDRFSISTDIRLRVVLLNLFQDALSVIGICDAWAWHDRMLALKECENDAAVLDILESALMYLQNIIDVADYEMKCVEEDDEYPY